MRRVLDDPGYRAAAQGIAAEMAALPPVEDAVGVLEALAAGARDRVAGQRSDTGYELA